MDAQKLLGSLLKQGLGRRAGFGGKAALGLGAIGIAVAAFEHFSEKQQAGAAAQPGSMQPPPAPFPATGGPPPGPAPATGSLPPPPPPGGGSPPPAPRVAARPSAPPAALASNTPIQDSQADALLLIRAMIGAANADGVIDAGEQSAILGRLIEAGLGDQERKYILSELSNPPTLDALLAGPYTPGQAQQIYAVSLLAIDVDTDAERHYLATLAQRLSLDERTVADLHTQLLG